MTITASAEPPRSEDETFRLTPAQLTFYETFGFLRIPGLFADVIDEIIDAFEAQIAEGPTMELREEVHFNERRVTVPGIVERNARLGELTRDPRILGIVESVLGPESAWAGSDGNLMWCDTSWHCDIYNAPMTKYHLKLFFYLDPVDAQSGGLRFIPGTNYFATSFAQKLRQSLRRWQDAESIFGVPLDELPSVSVASEPGDVILGNFRTIHATFHSGPRRRLFTMNYSDARPEGVPRASGDVHR